MARAVDILVQNANAILSVMKDWAGVDAKDVTFTWTNLDGSVESHTFGNAAKLNVDNSEHINNTNNPHAVTKYHIGLDNVDNTSDIDKPISTDVQFALNEKAPLVHTHNLADLSERSYNSLTDKPDVHDHSNKSILDGLGINDDGNLTYNGNEVDTVVAQRDVYDGLDSTDSTVSIAASQGPVIVSMINSKEDTFEKNTAFNKNFGTGVDDVANGTHSHNLANLSEKSYNSLTDKPDLSSLHTHDNKGVLDTFSSGRSPGLVNIGDYQIQLTKFFETREDLWDYVPRYSGELAYLIELDNFCRYDYSVSKWVEIGTGKSITRPGYGDGPSGVYSNGWEDENDIDLHFESDHWGNTVNGTDAGKWNRYDSTTPSSGTGSQEPVEGTYMVYGEMSSNGNQEFLELSSNYFSKLTRIALQYQLEGSNSGVFEVVTWNDADGETVQFSVSGDQGTDWHQIDLDVTGSNAEKVLIRYHDATGYQGDICIDDIIFESED